MENPTITIAQIEAILKFLARAQIQGAEAMIFVECVTALQKILTDHQESAATSTV